MCVCVCVCVWIQLKLQMYLLLFLITGCWGFHCAYRRVATAYKIKISWCVCLLIQVLPEPISKKDSWNINEKLAEKKVDPFLLRAILLKAEHKGMKSQFQHRKRCETFFRSLSSRYSNLLVDEPDKEPPKQKTQPEISVDTSFDRMNSLLVDQLAKRVSHLKFSIALEQRKSRDVVELPTPKKSIAPQMSITQRKSLKKMDNTIGAKMARHRWQVSIGLIMGMAKIATQPIKEAKEPFTAGDLTFDPAVFKANKSCSVLSADSKFILSQVPEKRNKEQIEEVVKNLQDMDIKSFNEYPISVQKKLVKVARYEVVTPQRVIIRQGRPAENLYFLIDGTVVVIEKLPISDNEENSEDLIILRKGAMFGETEMTNRLTRRATVISKATVELLTIERNDLLNVFADRQNPNEIPNHIKFLQHCEFIYFWPLETIINDLDKCTPYHYKKNVLIIEDSLKTDFLVVIRTGKCRVIRKLFKYDPRKESIPEQQQKSDKRTILKYNDEMLRQNFRTYSRQGSQFSSVFTADPFEYKMRVKASLDEIHLHPNQIEKPVPLSQKHSSYQIVENPKLQPSLSMRLSHHGTSSMKKSFISGSSKNDLNCVNKQEGEKNFGHRKSSLPKTKLEQALLLPATQEYLLDKSESKKHDTRIPVYVQVDTLKPNEVFGLDTLVFDRYYDNASNKDLCLVSGDEDRGVEVVLLSKTLFIEHASEQVAWRVRRMMKFYPDAEMLLDEIERQELWAEQKGGVVEEIFTGKPLLLKKTPWK